MNRPIVILLVALSLIALLITGCSGDKEPAVAEDGNTVKVHYTGTLDDGSIFDTSEGREPLEFVMGAGQMIPGFESAVRGMKLGESKTVTIPAEEAYGPHNPELVLEVGLEEMPEDLEYGVGDWLQMQLSDGRVIEVTVVSITDTNVTLDANHRLAGKDLTFEIELVEIR